MIGTCIIHYVLYKYIPLVHINIFLCPIKAKSDNLNRKIKTILTDAEPTANVYNNIYSLGMYNKSTKKGTEKNVLL